MLCKDSYSAHYDITAPVQRDTDDTRHLQSSVMGSTLGHAEIEAAQTFKSMIYVIDFVVLSYD